jgi:outer membrane protein OmpA-like peptidoglycan-associated protein
MVMKRTALAVVITFVMTGCATMREHPVACRATAALIGGTLGAVGGGVGTHEIEKEPVDDGEVAAGAAAGLVAGGLIGYLIGYYACPEEEVVVQERVAPPPPPRGTKIAEIPGPNFDFDKSTLTPAGQAKVADAARTLKDNPTIHVEVGGHTDSIGGDAYNQRLSERRARTVADELTRDGVSASRMTVRGYGERKPVADNGTDAGRARNRRVEIVVD